MKNIDYKWIALSCTTLGALFSVLSGSTLIVALPSIMKDLHASMNNHNLDDHGIYVSHDNTGAVDRPNGRYVWQKEALCQRICLIYTCFPFMWIITERHTIINL